MSALWFVFGILVLVFLKGCHSRFLEYKLKRQFLEDSMNDVVAANKNDRFFKLGDNELYFDNKKEK